MNTFVVPWLPTLNPVGQEEDVVPALAVILVGEGERLVEETFIIDSGADISMASRRRCEELGLDWSAGRPMTLHGIAARPECAIEARVHEVEVIIPDAECSIVIPVCFADGDTTPLLGRLGFFDAFRIDLNKSQRTTTLELLL